MDTFPRLEDFAGRWQVSRRIRDFRAGQVGHFAGTAQFDRATTGLHYREVGLLTIGTAPPLHASRDYIWHSDGALIHVAYGDGSPFHSFDPAAPKAHHHCAPDDYHVTYDFTRWPEWRSEWAVNGPRKDYRMITDYRRARGETVAVS